MEPSNTQSAGKDRWEINQQEKRKRTEEKEYAEKRRKILTRTSLAAGILIIVALGYGISRLPSRSEAERPGLAVPSQGQEHISVGASHPPYNSNPPTSGPHYAQPATWGVHDSELPDEQLIHNLEHGGIWISYNTISATTTSALEDIARSQSKVVLEPRSKDDAPIVLASWNRLLKLQRFDEQAILGFIEANRNQSPEPLAQ